MPERPQQQPAEQRLSALIDQELDVKQLDSTLNALAEDAQLRARWERYHLIAGALRGMPVTHQYRTISQRLSHQLEHLPKPQPRPSVQPRRSRPMPGSLAWWPLAGTVLAGGAALSLMLLQPGPMISPGAPPSGIIAGSAPDVRMPAPSSQNRGWLDQNGAALPVAGVRTRHGITWVTGQPEVRYRLNQLLAGHHERVADSNLKGFLPYATLVSYDTQP